MMSSKILGCAVLFLLLTYSSPVSAEQIPPKNTEFPNALDHLSRLPNISELFQKSKIPLKKMHIKPPGIPNYTLRIIRPGLNIDPEFAVRPKNSLDYKLIIVDPTKRKNLRRLK